MNVAGSDPGADFPALRAETIRKPLAPGSSRAAMPSCGANRARQRHERAAASEQRRLRRRARAECRARWRMVGGLLQVREDALDEGGVLDAGDHREPPAAAAAVLEVDGEHAFESLRPTHGEVPGGRLLDRACVAVRALAAAGRGDRGAQRRRRGEHAVVPGQVHPRHGHQDGETGEEVQRLEQDVGGAVAVGGLEPIAHPALGRERQPFDRYGGTAHIAGEWISYVSPIARSLIGASVGDIVALVDGEAEILEIG